MWGSCGVVPYVSGATVVLRLDTALGLVENYQAAHPYYPTEFEIDSDRGLLFVAGSDLQIFDLGVVTTGEPRWPGTVSGNPNPQR